MKRWILLLVICLFAAPAWSQSLQDLERLAQQHRLTTQEGTPVSFRPDRGGLLLMFGCEGCRHSHEDEEELQMILKRFADQSMQIVIAPLPADHFPGNTLFPGNILAPEREVFPGSTLFPGNTLSPTSAETLARAVRFSPDRHVMVYDPRGNQAFAGDLAGLVRFTPGRR